MTRYAIYYAPAPESALWRFGSHVLGYDAYGGSALTQPNVAGLTAERFAALTEEPRRYGFHATLKPPFHLVDDHDEASLLRACENFAGETSALSLPGLAVTAIGPFVALTPASPSAALHTLADAAVEAFEPFRAPLSPADLDRRRAAGLSERQDLYLRRWGYPYVFEEFRFHMTLTGSLPAELREDMKAALAAAYRAEGRPIEIDAIALFRQDRRDGRFVIERRFPLRGPR